MKGNDKASRRKKRTWRLAVAAAMIAAVPFCIAARAKPPVPEATSEDISQRIHQMVFEDRKLLYDEIKAALRRYLGDIERVQVDLEPARPAGLLAGRFDEIRVRLDDLVVKDLPVHHARMRMRNCVLDLPILLSRRKFRFKDQGETDVLLVVKEDGMNTLFRNKRQKLKLRNPTIDFRRGHVRFSGGIRVLFIKNHLRVAGRMTVRDGTKVYFHPRWMNLDLLPVPGFLVRALSRRVNPIATLDAFKFKVNVSVVETTDDTLYLATESMRPRVEAMIAEEKAAAVATSKPIEGKGL